MMNLINNLYKVNKKFPQARSVTATTRSVGQKYLKKTQTYFN